MANQFAMTPTGAAMQMPAFTRRKVCEHCTDECEGVEHVEGWIHTKNGPDDFQGDICPACKHDDFISFDHYGEYMFNRYGADWSNVEHDAYEARCDR